MTRAKDISKIITDADFSGTLDVTGDLTVDTNTLYVDSTNNNVGIGTSSPIRQLSLQNSSNAEISLVSGTSSNCSLLMGDGTSGTDFYRGYIQYQNSNDAMLFATSTGERMRIDSSGNVGIGTSSPSVKLEVTGASNSTATSIKPQGALPDNNDNAGLYVLHQGTAGTGLRVRTDNALTGSNFAHILVNNASASINAFQVSQYGSGYIADFNKSGTTALRIDNNGSITSTAASGNMASFASSTNAVEFKILSPTANVVRLDTGTSDVLAFAPAGTEAMRINSSGELLLRTTVSENNSIMTINNATSHVGKNGITFCTSSTGTAFSHLLFKNPNGNVGSVTTNGSSTAYNTSSDHRLKENVTADWDATTRLKQLNPVRFNFIADADTTVDGFLAHEVQSVVPEAISGTHNEVDDDGNPVYQGIDQSKLVPLLVKTIQELEARITVLETA